MGEAETMEEQVLDVVIVEHKQVDMIPTIHNFGLQFEVVPNCVGETDTVVTGPDLMLS